MHGLSLSTEIMVPYWRDFVITILKKAINSPGKAVCELGYRILKPFGKKQYTKFIILGRSRTGSNLLLSYLNSHINVRAEREIFKWLKGRDENELLNKNFAKEPFFIRAKGFKIFYYHPYDKENGEIWKLLSDTKDLHVIHIKRKNILRTLVSKKIAQNSKAYTSEEEKKTNKVEEKINFDFDELNNLITHTRNLEKTGDDIFSGNKMITVYYEDLVENPELYFKTITDFLGLEYKKPRTSYKKQNPEKLSELLENF
jgi:LPS sulfotransferase NodH